VMGCRTSSTAPALGVQQQESDSLRNTLTATLREKLHRTAESEKKPEGAEPQPLQVLSSDNILKLLGEVGASSDQIIFFQGWAKTVLNEALNEASAGHQRIVVATDCSYIEMRVTASQQIMLELARKFAEACSCFDSKLFKELEVAQQTLQAATVTHWCRLKHVGTKSAAADAGISLNETLEWTTADMLMPPVHDSDTVREYGTHESLKPSSFSSSFFPVEPERALIFQLGIKTPKKSLLTGIFFFKALGFVKPDESVLRVLTSCQSSSCSVSVSMGPRGLTRVVLSLHDILKPIAPELARTLDFGYKANAMEAIATLLGRQPQFLDYVAETRGYTVAVGFTL